MTRRKARESAMQMLFQLDVGQNSWEEAVLTLEEADLADSYAAFTEKLVRGAWENAKEIDLIIDKYADQWQVNRLANVDKAVLRIALYELLYLKETEAPIIINEAVNLVKIFGTEESGSFVNGILDAVYNKEVKTSLSDAVSD